MYAARVDFGDGEEGFARGTDFAWGTDFDCRHTDWYKNFSETKAEIFLADRVLSHMGPHQLRDFLVVCRNSLRVGGRLRIGESDGNRHSGAGKIAARRTGPSEAFDIETLTDLLLSVGLAPSPVEFCDRQGILHEFEPSFDRYGRIRTSSRSDPRDKEAHGRSSSLIVDGIKIAGDRKGSDGFAQKIFAVGDSHVRFLAGCDEGHYDASPAGEDVIRFEGFSSKFIGLHLGPGLAFNLNTSNTKNRSREKLEELMRTAVLPKGASVMFSFGEIDCRYHVCRQADRQIESIEAIVDAITGEYALFLDWVQAQGFQASVWGVPGVTWIDEAENTGNPIYGSYEQRLFAATRFNARMKDICDLRKMPFLSVFDAVCDPNLAPRKDLFFDAVHLSQRARPLLHDLMPSGVLPL